MRTYLAIASLLLASACAPTCSETCDKLLSCELDAQRMHEDECLESCELQLNLYQIWEDSRLEDQFDDHRSCLVTSTCEEIADGECYDEDLFQFYVDE